MKKTVVTSALPYANGSIHVGHLVEYIQTDIFVRFLKLIGEHAIYCCADDTHGAPIEINAKKLGVKPEELIKKFHKEHQDDFKSFLINFDSYYSTNSKENKKWADYIFNELNKKKLIYKKKELHTYCEKCKRFLPDRYVKGKCPDCGAEDQYGDVCESCGKTHHTTDLIEPKCSICGHEAIQKESEHYYFKLSALSDKLKKWLEDNKKLQPEIRNYVLNWIKEGLNDWCISRDAPYFGFKIPGETDKYYYVWLDAPIGYISSTENYCKNSPDKVEDYWFGKDSEIIHVIGKDIIYFHYLFWPAMLMESGINPPTYLVTHGFLTVNGEKMSKSRGTFFTAKDFLELYDPEHLRFYYAGMLSRKMLDIDLDFNDFVAKINGELVANLSNFCYRTLSFTAKNFESVIDEIDNDADVIKEVEKKFDSIKAAYQDFNFKDALKLILEVSHFGNKYMQDKQPWKLIDGDREAAKKVLGTCVNIVKNLSILIAPVMPKISENLQKQLNVEKLSWADLGFDLKKHKIGKPKILVSKIDKKVTEEIFPLNLRVAEIEKVEDHPEADKLYVLQVNLGDEKRQLVAGIKPHYSKEELKGQKVVVVTNLKPAKLKGVESKGMLLAAKKGDKVKLLSSKLDAGTQIKVKEHKIKGGQIRINDFAGVKLKVKGKKVFLNKTELEGIEVDIEDGAKIS